MLYLNFMFMGNLRFSYIRDRGFIIDEGYLPLLDILKNYPELRSEISSSSYTTLELRNSCPEIINKIKEGISENRIRTATNGFEHVFLPTLSIFGQEKLIQKGVKTDVEVYGQQPTGFWPSDCEWDSTVIPTLKKNGIQWAFTGDWLIASNPGGRFYNDYEDYDCFEPVSIRGPENQEITNIQSSGTNYDILLKKNSEYLESLMEKLTARAESGKDGFFKFAFDLELLAVLKSDMWKEFESIAFEELINRLLNIPNTCFSFTEDFLMEHPPEKKVCFREGIKCSSVGDSWTDGCYKLDMTCKQAERYILDIEDILTAGNFGDDSEYRERLEKIWERYLFSMQSEARMTNYDFMWKGDRKCHEKCLIYPPDEMTLEAQNDAITALRAARKLKQEIMGDN